MPRISRWFARAGLVYLLVGLAANAAATSLADAPIIIASRPVRTHLLVVGWVTQLIVAVMLWMFPKFSKDQPYGREWLSWLAFFLLNAGLIMRAVAEPMQAWAQGSGWGQMLALSALCQLIAALSITLNVWPRVRAR